MSLVIWHQGGLQLWQQRQHVWALTALAGLAARAGADIATVPFKVLEQAAKYPLTGQGIERFLAEWQPFTHQTSERSA